MKYQMRASESDATVHEVLIYDFIGDWIDGLFGFGVTAKSFIDELASMPESVKTVRVRVNSPGGDVFAAVAIANVLRDQRVSKGRKVEMFVDGLAASAASLVIMAGDTIQMADNGLIMVHDAWTVKQGNARDLRAEAEKLDKLRDAAIVPTYQWHVKLSAPAILELMAKETWMNADEAVALGFATEKVEGLRAAAALDLSQPVQLIADPLHADALSALLAIPPKKKKEEPAPAPPEEPAAPVPGEPAVPAPADPDAPADEPVAAPGEPEAAPAEPKKEQKDLLEEAKEHVGKVHEIVDGLMAGSVVADEKSLTELLEHVTLLEDAIDQMPPIPGPIKKEEPKPEEDAPAAPAPAPAPEEKPKALEMPIVQASLILSVPVAEVIRRCVENKLSLTFASSLYDAELTEEELAVRINTEASRLSAESTRVTAVRAMFKKYNMENVGDLVAEAGIGVAAAGRLVTELKALKESAEIDGSLTLTGGKVHKVLSYRETYDRVNNPLKKEN